MMRISPYFLSVAYWIVACTEPQPTLPDGVTVVDSAGIELVTNHTPLLGDGAWRLGERIVRIGRFDGDASETLGDPRGARRLSADRIAISDRMENRVRVFDMQGEQVAAYGGDGDGPGEYRLLWSLRRYRRDSVLAVELGARRLSVLGPDGRFGRRITSQPTFDFRTAGGRPEQSCCAVVGAIGSEIVLAYPGVIPSGGLGVRRSTVMVVRMDATGMVRDTVGVFQSAEYHPAPAGSPNPLVPASLTSRATVTAGESGIYVTTGEMYEIQEFSADGQLRRLMRIAGVPRPVTDEVKEAFLTLMDSLLTAQLASRPEMAEETTRVRRMYETTPFHATVPAIAALAVDRAGNVWASNLPSWLLGADTDTWDVFDPDGRWLTTVHLPGRAEVMDLGADYVIVRVEDEFDVPYVDVYALEKP